jgi:protein-disulfide isomerase
MLCLKNIGGLMNAIRRREMHCNADTETRPVLTAWLLAVLCCLTLLVAAGCGSDSKPAATSADLLPGIDEMLSEKVLGDPNAPITIIDYSALTCPHCADFDLNTLPQLAAKYIDTGKAKLLYRDFPFSQAGLTASMLARCSGNAHYFEALDLIYKNQASWASETDPENALVSILGMPQAKADACLADKALADGMQEMEKTAQQSYGVNATPTFIINGQKIIGDQPFAVFDQLLGALAP